MSAAADTTAKSRSTSDFAMLPGLAKAEKTIMRLMMPVVAVRAAINMLQ